MDQDSRKDMMMMIATLFIMNGTVYARCAMKDGCMRSSKSSDKGTCRDDLQVRSMVPHCQFRCQ